MYKPAVKYSVISSSDLNLMINELYNLGNIVECRFLCNGLNDTYLITTNESKYILRIYKTNWRNKNDIDFEIELLGYLIFNGIPVSHSIPKKDGNYITEIGAPEGQRFAVLFTYAEGDFLDNKESALLYGEQVAMMHLAMDTFECNHNRFSIDLDHLLTNPIHSIKSVFSDRPEDIAYLESLALLLQKRVENISHGLEWGVCHGDLHGWNVHFHNDTLTHFDFDCGGYGWRAYDLSVFLWSRVRGRTKEHFKNESWSVFLESYLKIKPLSDIDLASIATFVAIREIWLMGLHTGNSEVWGANNYGDHFSGNLKFLKEWCEENNLN